MTEPSFRIERHVFVCTTGSTCPTQGSQGVRDWLKAESKKRFTPGELRINQAGCFSQCGHGPMIAVYPDGVFYAHVTLEDARRIFEEHLVGGRPVEDLVYRNAPGPNKLPRDAAERVLTDHPAYRPCGRCAHGNHAAPHAEGL